MIHTRLRQTHTHKTTWQQLTLRVRKLCAQEHIAGIHIYRLLGQQQFARLPVHRTIGQEQLHRQAVARFDLALLDGLTQIEQLVFALAEVHIHRVHLVDVDQGRHITAPHQRTFSHQRMAYAATDGRGHHGAF